MFLYGLRFVVIWLLVIYLVEGFYLVIGGYLGWSKHITNRKLGIWCLVANSVSLRFHCQVHLALRERGRALWGRVMFMPSFRMPRDPFRALDDQHSELGYGEGRFPDPILDYSGGGSISRIPIADPDRTEQIRQLAAGKRSDLNNPSETAYGQGPQSGPDPYLLGNTDRYGAQPPLVRNRKRPKPSTYSPPKPTKMERHW